MTRGVRARIEQAGLASAVVRFQATEIPRRQATAPTTLWPAAIDASPLPPAALAHGQPLQAPFVPDPCLSAVTESEHDAHQDRSELVIEPIRQLPILLTGRHSNRKGDLRSCYNGGL